MLLTNSPQKLARRTASVLASVHTMDGAIEACPLPDPVIELDRAIHDPSVRVIVIVPNATFGSDEIPRDYVRLPHVCSTLCIVAASTDRCVVVMDTNHHRDCMRSRARAINPRTRTLFTCVSQCRGYEADTCIMRPTDVCSFDHLWKVQIALCLQMRESKVIIALDWIRTEAEKNNILQTLYRLHPPCIATITFPCYRYFSNYASAITESIAQITLE